MNMLSIIEKKRDGKELTYEELKFFVDGVVNRDIDECQIGAMLMAITASGFSCQEGYYYAKLLAESGDIIDISKKVDKCVDKHSTGGVTDSCTLVVLPVLACLGYNVAKYSTKNIGASFGTLDRLGVFDGYQPAITLKKFYQIIQSVGISIIGSSDKILPADKLLYKYREKTGTIPSLPLIACSIMAKKIVMGAKTVVLDIKCGEGSLLSNLAQAEKLAALMVDIGKMAGIRTSAILSNLNQPLGMAIGPMLEVKEALTLLSGDKSQYGTDLYKMCREMVVHIMLSSGDEQLKQSAEERFDKIIESGVALTKLKDMIIAHGGKTNYFDDFNELIPKVNTFYITAEKTGYLYDIDTKGLYQAINVIGANENGTINRSVGIEIMAREGDKVYRGDKLAKVYYALEDPTFAAAVTCMRRCFKIEKSKKPEQDIIYKIIC